MSSTQDCLEAIVAVYRNTKQAHWKRRHKQESLYGEVARVFENIESGVYCTVYSFDGRHVVKDGNLMPKTDSKTMKALVKAANSIVHCGDGMSFYWNPTTMTAWMAMADSDCPSEEQRQEPGYELTTGEEVIRRMKEAGAKRVLLVAETHPFWDDINPEKDDEEEYEKEDDEMNEESWWLYFGVNGVTGKEVKSKF
jgi:hypothetical protein